MNTLIKKVMYSFGSGIHGNLATGFRGSISPVMMDQIEHPTKVYATGSDSVFVVTADSSVYAYGRGENYVLGNGNNVNSCQPTKVDVPPIQELAVSQSHVVALDKQHRVWTWGTRALGRTGTPEELRYPAQPRWTGAVGNTPIISVGAGINHSIVVTEDGTPYGFGSDADGCLGLNKKYGRDEIHEPVLIPVPNDDKIKRVSCGKRFSLLLSRTGHLYSMGDNSFKQCGVNDANSRSVHVPTRVHFPTDITGKPTLVRKVSAGQSHSIALSRAGEVFTWGLNTDGQLGLSQNAFTVAQPERINFFNDKHVIDVRAGGTHTGVLTKNDGKRELWLFGANREGQLTDLHRTSLASKDKPILLDLPDLDVTFFDLGNNTTYVGGIPLDSLEEPPTKL